MHYVIGDVHGCYNALMKLLDKLCLTPEDRVYFVGDFMDRAPTHEEMLKTNQWVCDHITEEGQFQAVIGNHDLSMLDTYRKLAVYEGAGNLFMLTAEDTFESLGNVVRTLRHLPLYLEVQAGGYRNIITHSWLCNGFGDTSITDEGEISNDYSISESVWDRYYSVYCIPSGCRVIHGHTITSTGYFDTKQKGAQNRIIRLGDTNVNIDCGCFMGLSNGGNLAAFRLEDGMEFYAYDMNDAIAEYKELAELTQEPFKLEDYQIFMTCNPLREAVFSQDNSDYTRYALDSLTRDYGLDYSNQEEFLERCRSFIRMWSYGIKKYNAIDRRFILWRG